MLLYHAILGLIFAILTALFATPIKYHSNEVIWIFLTILCGLIFILVIVDAICQAIRGAK
ncbi:MAG: hypothetical protein PHT40_01725 [Patescibacteria group bacterium]|nr:hypothetical protein [Patescibacteria group bacterium]